MAFPNGFSTIQYCKRPYSQFSPVAGAHDMMRAGALSWCLAELGSFPDYLF
jgi:hypothetical protein